jgi:RNA-directed DNA polymerase
MALDGLEAELQRHWPRKGNYQPGKIHLIRYADDFVITGESQDLLAEQVKPVVEAFLRERGLLLSTEKTLVTHITEGFDFLGYNVRKFPAGRSKYKLLIRPAKKSVKTFLHEIRAFIKDNPTMPAAALIRALNPRIRGWALYHRHVASRKVFEKVDHEIFKALWLWTRRLHKNKGKRWIIKRYWRTVGKRHWVFTGETKGRKYTLFKAGDINIVPHVKIQNQANPFNAGWEVYFERRAFLQSLQDTYGPLRTVLKRQEGRCPICRQMLEGSPADWDLHHIVPVTKGGSEHIENKIYLHPACHDQLHWLRAKEAALPHEVIRKA